MKTCPACDRCMKRDTSSGLPRFECDICGRTVAATRDDLRVGGETPVETHSSEMLKRFAHDRVISHVEKECPLCHRPYMAIVTDNRRAYLVCKHCPGVVVPTEHDDVS